MHWSVDVSTGPPQILAFTDRKAIEDFVTVRLGRLLEQFKVLENLIVDFNLVVEANAVFTEKIEDDFIWRLESNMFEFQRTATDGICLIFAFFVASTQCELVDEIYCCCSLPICHDLVFQLVVVVLAYTINMFLNN